MWKVIMIYIELIDSSHSDGIFVTQALQIHSISEPSVLGLGKLRLIQPGSSAILCPEESEGVWSFVLFNDAWSQKGHSASNTTVILA